MAAQKIFKIIPTSQLISSQISKRILPQINDLNYIHTSVGCTQVNYVIKKHFHNKDHHILQIDPTKMPEGWSMRINNGYAHFYWPENAQSQDDRSLPWSMVVNNDCS